MNKSTKISIVVITFAVFVCIGFAIKTTIENHQYEKAKVFNTAVQAVDAEHFNYAVDSRQGNVLASGIFTAKDPVKMEGVTGEYTKIVKTKERYTQHTDTYQCGTSKNPQTCIRTYYTWDYYSSDEKQTTQISFFGRDYISSIFQIDISRQLDCDVVQTNCKSGYGYQNGGWWESEGDIRYYYTVRDTQFFGTILASTMTGTLLPTRGTQITISEIDITNLLKEINNPITGIVFIVCWILFALITAGFTTKTILESY